MRQPSNCRPAAMSTKPKTFLEAQQALHEAWLTLGKAVVEEFGLLRIYSWLVKNIGHKT